jgi:hypothetical protein
VSPYDSAEEGNQKLTKAWLLERSDSNRSMAGSTSGGGRVNYALVNTLKDAWQREGWREKSIAEKKKAVALMILVVNTDCSDPADREATLDYIQCNIDSW